jgi:hypothetical protein
MKDEFVERIMSLKCRQVEKEHAVKMANFMALN